MQSEDFDKRVREAADNHHPAYDEKAWSKMEKLLEKHLPTKEDNRKRILFFVLLFLLLGAGSTWMFTNKPWKRTNKPVAALSAVEKKQSTIDNVKSTIDNTQSTTSSQPETELPGTPTGTNSINNSSDKNISTTNNTAVSFLTTTQAGKKTKNQLLARNTDVTTNKNDRPQPVSTIPENNNAANSKPIDRSDETKLSMEVTTPTKTGVVSDNSNINTVTTNIPESKTNGKEEAKKDDKKVENPDPGKAQSVVTKELQKGSKKSNTFFFTLSAGPDVSGVGDKAGSVKLLAGVGMGYTFHDRFTIRTGFYSGRKVYTASPEAYHPPKDFWTYYPYMEKIDANCKVYEIPLSLSYNFGRSSRQNWFASTGLSTYLMKKEDYNYFYKQAPTGPTYNYKYSISNENKHFFSVLTLSGGYQRNLGKNFSIMAEPYLKLPLGGIGFGKVKLNDAGVLVSLAIKPFAHSAKKDRVSQ